MPRLCIVTCCTQVQALHHREVLDLQLCGPHLRALRHMCKGKHRLAYAALAVREAKRITSTGKGHRRGRIPVPYRCSLAPHWHVGQQPEHADGLGDPEAHAAAVAVRALLTSHQLDQLLHAWQHGQAQPAHAARRRPAPSTT